MYRGGLASATTEVLVPTAFYTLSCSVETTVDQAKVVKTTIVLEISRRKELSNESLLRL